jgi:Flp pilus assembly protein TadG
VGFASQNFKSQGGKVPELATNLLSRRGIMLFARFFEDRKGGVAPILALGLVPLIGAVGTSVDYSRANSVRAAMQAAVDATAVILLKETGSLSSDQLNVKGKNYFNANFGHAELQNVAVTAAISTASGTSTLTLSAAGSLGTTFARVLGFSTVSVSAGTAVTLVQDGLGCVLSLSPTASGALSAAGSTSVSLTNCSLYDNSNSSTALTAGGSARVETLSVGVVGGVTGRDNITSTQGIKTGITPLIDPYRDVANPTASGTNQSSCNGQCPHGTATLDPGIYKQGMKLVAGANITLNSGVYYLQDDLSVQGGATLSGTGVTLVFTSSNGTKYATASISGNATVNLTAPTTGATAGIVAFADRNTPSDTSFKFNGGSTQYLGGAVYVPSASIDYAGGAGTSTSCTQIIGNTVTFSGNSNVAINCSSYKTRPFSSTVVKIVS